MPDCEDITGIGVKGSPNVMTLTIRGERPLRKAAPAEMSEQWRETLSPVDMEKGFLQCHVGRGAWVWDQTAQGLNPSSATHCFCHLGEVT